MRYRRHVGVLCILLGSSFSCAFAWQLAQSPAEKYIAAMDDPHRVLKVDEVIAKLGLKPGDIVADIGSGSGVVFHSDGQSYRTEWNSVRS